MYIFLSCFTSKRIYTADFWLKSNCGVYFFIVFYQQSEYTPQISFSTASGGVYFLSVKRKQKNIHRRKMQKHKENVFLTKSAARGYLFAANSALGAPPAVYKILRAARAVRGHVQQPATRRAGCPTPLPPTNSSQPPSSAVRPCACSRSATDHLPASWRSSVYFRLSLYTRPHRQAIGTIWPRPPWTKTEKTERHDGYV